MTDFNTWNESIIEAVQKSLGNDSYPISNGLCSRCTEILIALREILNGTQLLGQWNVNAMKYNIKCLEDNRPKDAELNNGFTWANSPQGDNFWHNHYRFLRGGHECDD